MLLHASTLEKCCYIKNPTNDLKILQKFPSKKPEDFHEHCKNRSSQREYFVKMVFLKFLQVSQKSTCVEI